MAQLTEMDIDAGVHAAAEHLASLLAELEHHEVDGVGLIDALTALIALLIIQASDTPGERHNAIGVFVSELMRHTFMLTKVPSDAEVELAQRGRN
jgi:hypothetical protein